MQGTFHIRRAAQHHGPSRARPGVHLAILDYQRGHRAVVDPSPAEHGLMVSGQPAPIAQRAAAEVEREATRSLRVLWRDRELGGVVTVPPRSRMSMAEVALSPQPPSVAELESVPTPPPALPAGARAHHA